MYKSICYVDLVFSMKRIKVSLFGHVSLSARPSMIWFKTCKDPIQVLAAFCKQIVNTLSSKIGIIGQKIS